MGKATVRTSAFAAALLASCLAFAAPGTPALYFSNGASSSVSVSGQGALRYNLGTNTLQASLNGSAWTDIAGSGGASGPYVTAVGGSFPISSSGGWTPTLSCATCIVGVPTTTGDLLYSTAGGQSMTALHDVAAGSYLRSGGTSAAPAWSTLTLPNSAATGDLLYATAPNTVGTLADVAVNQVLLSGGVGVAPSWGMLPNAGLINSSLTVGTSSPLSGGGSVSLGGALTLTCATCVVTTGSYADPSWITSLASSKISWSSGSANQVFATPNGSAGTPSLRALVNADLPASGVSAATYGDSSHVAQVALNAQGIATSASSVAIAATTISTTSPLAGGASVAPGGSLTLTCSTCITQAYVTVKNSAGTAQTQRSNLTFGSDFSVADSAPDTVVSLASNSLTVTAGTGLTGGGSVALGSSVSLSLPNTGPGAGTVGSAGITSITLDTQGRVTAAATATYLTSAFYQTIKNSAGTGQTQRSNLKFGSDFSVSDSSPDTVLALASNSVTVNTSSPLGGGGSLSLGGSLTLTCTTCVLTTGDTTLAAGAHTWSVNAAASDTAGSDWNIRSQDGGAASSTGGGNGGRIIMRPGDGGASDGTHSAGNGASMLARGGIGGAGSGTVNGGTGGSASYVGFTGGAAGSNSTGGTGGQGNFLGGDGGAASGASATSGTGATALLAGGAAGAANSGATGANGGAVIIRGGAKSGSGTNGTITIGDANTSSIAIATSAVPVNLGRGTVTQASSITTGVTVNTPSGVITTVSASTAAGATSTFTVTCSAAAAASVVLVSLGAYSGTFGTNGNPTVTVSTVAAGSFNVTIYNAHASNALSGTLKINYVAL